MFNRVFNAAQGVLIDEITGCGNDEKIANVLVEDDFGCRARVGAGKYDGKGVLTVRSFGSFGGSGFAGGDFGCGKAGIAFFEFCESGIGVEGSGGVVGGKDKPS